MAAPKTLAAARAAARVRSASIAPASTGWLIAMVMPAPPPAFPTQIGGVNIPQGTLMVNATTKRLHCMRWSGTPPGSSRMWEQVM